VTAARLLFTGMLEGELFSKSGLVTEDDVLADCYVKRVLSRTFKLPNGDRVRAGCIVELEGGPYGDAVCLLEFSEKRSPDVRLIQRVYLNEICRSYPALGDKDREILLCRFFGPEVRRPKTADEFLRCRTKDYFDRGITRESVFARFERDTERESASGRFGVRPRSEEATRLELYGLVNLPWIESSRSGGPVDLKLLRDCMAVTGESRLIRGPLRDLCSLAFDITYISDDRGVLTKAQRTLMRKEPLMKTLADAAREEAVREMLAAFRELLGTGMPYEEVKAIVDKACTEGVYYLRAYLKRPEQGRFGYGFEDGSVLPRLSGLR
jgi:hypothetical protein